MTDIEFYVLEQADADVQRLAIKLALDAYRQYRKVHIHSENALQAAAIDEQLWHYSQSSFIAHESHETHHAAPIQIGFEQAHLKHFDTLLFTGAQLPNFLSRFERFIYVVAGTDEAKSIARKHYKHFKQRGYPLNYKAITHSNF